MNNKVKTLYNCYNKFTKYTTTDKTLYNLCEKIVGKLTNEEYEYLITYMQDEKYPAVYKAVEESMTETVTNTFAAALQDSFDTFEDDPNKYGKN